MSFDPISAALGIAPIATNALEKIRARNSVASLFRLLRVQLRADARIPNAIRESIAEQVAGDGNPLGRTSTSGLAIDPFFMGCVLRLLDDGDVTALADARAVLRARLRIDSKTANLDAILDAVVDAIDDSIGPAQPNERVALHHEHRRLRKQLSALEERLGANSTVPVFIDVLWAPGALQAALSRLGTMSPAELAWLTAQFKQADAYGVASDLVAEPPSEAVTGSDQLWVCIAKFAERSGAWDAAIAAWLQAGQRSDEGPVPGMVNAAIAAHVAGDRLRYDQLMAGAEGIDAKHPRVRLEKVGRLEDPMERLEALQRIEIDTDDRAALLECHRALAYMQLRQLSDASRSVAAAEARAAGLLQVRIVRVNLEVERGRAAVREDESVDAAKMREIYREAIEIRARLLEQRRFEESAHALVLAADAAMLGGDLRLAGRSLYDATEDELATQGGRGAIAWVASRLGAHSLVLTLITDPKDDDESWMRAGALTFVGTPTEREEAVRTLDQLILNESSVGERAALTRVLLTLFLPADDWPDAATRRLRGSEDEGFGLALYGKWLAAHGRWDEIDKALTPCADDPRWLASARFEAFQSHPDPDVRRDVAKGLLRAVPDDSSRFSCGVTLWDCGDRDRAEAEIRAVAKDANATFFVRCEAHRFLVMALLRAGEARAALQILDDWDRLDPGSAAASALRVPVAASLSRQKHGS